MNITRKRVDELREELESRGLDSSGTRPTLLRRLRAALDSSATGTLRYPHASVKATRVSSPPVDISNNSGQADTEPQSSPELPGQAMPVLPGDRSLSPVTAQPSISKLAPATTRQAVPVSPGKQNMEPPTSKADVARTSEHHHGPAVVSGVETNENSILDGEPAEAVERISKTVEEVVQAKTTASGHSEVVVTDSERVDESKGGVEGESGDDQAAKSSSIVAATETTSSVASGSNAPTGAAKSNPSFRRLERMVPPPANESVEEAILRRRKRFGPPTVVKIERSHTAVGKAAEQVDASGGVAEGAADGKDGKEDKVIEKEGKGVKEGDKNKSGRPDKRTKGIVKQKHRGKAKGGVSGRRGNPNRGNNSGRFSHDQGGRERGEDRGSNGRQSPGQQPRHSLSPARPPVRSPSAGSDDGRRPISRGRIGGRGGMRNSRQGRSHGQGRGHGQGRATGQGRSNGQGQRVVRQDGGRPNNDRPNNDMPVRGKKRRTSGDDSVHKGDDTNQSRPDGNGEVDETVRRRMQRFTAGMANRSGTVGAKDSDGLGAEEAERRMKRQRRFYASSSKS